MLNRLPEAVVLAKKLSRYGGLFVILIHPDVLGQKLKFEQQFIGQMDNTIWYGSLNEFGAWWAARDQVGIDVSKEGNQEVVSITAPVAISGLTLEVPFKWVYIASPNLKATQEGQRIVIEHLVGKAKLTFRIP